MGEASQVARLNAASSLPGKDAVTDAGSDVGNAAGFSRAGKVGAPLVDIKNRIRTAQIWASLSVNRELIQLYWDIGHLIVE